MEREVDFGLRLTWAAASHVAARLQVSIQPAFVLFHATPFCLEFGKVADAACLFLTMEWDPSCFFRSGCRSPYALLVLNQPINESAFSVLSEHGELNSGKG